MNGHLNALVWDRWIMDYAPRMGWACYHSFWQGLVMAGLLQVALYAISRSSENRSNLRYSISLFALFAIPILGFATFLKRDDAIPQFDLADKASGVSIDRFLGAISLHESVPLLYDFRSWIVGFLPIISLLWVAGFLIAAIRLVQGWFFARRLVTQAVVFDDPVWQGRLERLRDAMGVQKSVRLLKSESINTPAVVGWINPVILWPASAITQMSPQGIHAILAHELAHIRRRDYILNMFQSIFDAVYFYHPATWWMTRQVRLEREHCADELAVQILESSSMGTRIGYGQTLLNLEEHRPSQVFTIRATGGFLLPRIRRITGDKEPGVSFSHLMARLLTIVLVTVLLSSIAMAVKPVITDAQVNIESEPSTTELARSDDPQSATGVVITEPIAQAIIARLSARRIDTDALCAVRDGMWEAIRAGNPLTLEQVHTILAEYGYESDILHSPPQR
jgi:beta-lactamase regulating signal transducer with metallopeptidase domain